MFGMLSIISFAFSSASSGPMERIAKGISSDCDCMLVGEFRHGEKAPRVAVVTEGNSMLATAEFRR